MSVDFVSLHNQTDFSILDSICSVKDLFNRAKDLGQTAIAITEHGSFASAWDAWKVSKATGVKLIIGVELYFRNNLKDEDERMSHILLLAKNQVGYNNILTLNKLGFDTDSKVGKRAYPIINWDLLEKYSDGVICLTACGNGIISQMVMKREFDAAEECALRLKKIFGDNLGFEVQPNNMVRGSNIYNDEIDQKFINHRLINLGEKLGIRVVAACNTHYINKDDYKTHDVFLAIGARQPVFSAFRLRYPVPDFYLKSGEEVKSFFSRNYGDDLAEQLCLNSLYFASLCEVPEWIDPKFSNPSGKELPIFPVKDEPDYEEFKVWSDNQVSDINSLDEDKQYLRYLIEKNFLAKTKNIDSVKLIEYKERLAEEFDVLEFHGFSSYMLIVSDYINWAKKNGIAVGAGRGCLSAEGKILTEKGYKNIIDINIGDRVYSHTGKLRNVINKYVYDCNEDCVSIKTNYSFDDLVFTNDHKLFAIKQRLTDRYKKASEKTRKKIRKYDNLDDPSWVAVKDLKVGDFIFMPFVKRNICKENVPNEFIIKTSSTRNSKLDITSTIKVDSDFIYFLGRWVGDGWITTHNSDSYDVGLAFHSDDIKSISWFTNYLNKFFNVSIQKHKTKQLVQLIVHNKSLFNIMLSLFPYYKKTSSTKHLPIFFRDLNDYNLRILLNGYINSDGSVEKQNHSNTFRYNIDSTSKRLMFETREILNFLKIKSYVSVRKPFIRHGKVKKYLCKESYKIRFLYESDINSEGYVVQIKSLDKIKCNKVYDITVEKDHSYVTQNFAAHNSVGGSLIAYILGIHDADPIKYGLIFARFHNKEKSSFPDIDTDFAPSGRALVQEYLRKKYGEDHVAHVSNVNTITPKVYVRDIARACELGGSKEAAVKLGNDVADCISADIKSIDMALEKVPLFGEYCNKYPEFIEYKDICGKYRAWSTHSGGIIISQRPLTGLIPLRRDKEGSLAIEYDKEKAEDNGLVKMDTLGLSTLDTINKTLNLIKAADKEFPNQMYDYDSYDKKTYDLISSGDTFKVFQFGTSGGTIDLCKQINPKNIEDLANINALARPSARDMRYDFIATKNGKNEVKLLHPSLNRGFGKTYGFGLYEECLMYLAQDVAGWSLHEADRLRKLTKAKGKYPEKAKAWRKEFLEGGKNNNIDPLIVKKIWDDVVEKFQGYGFNLAHATLYSMIGYQTAYLKAHYPIEFLQANLMDEVNSNAQDAKNNIEKIKKELRQHGVKIVPPDINKSDLTYKLVEGNKLITGLDALKFVGEGAIKDIVSKRPFKSFFDFMVKVDSKVVRANNIQALAVCGAFDDFGISRKLLFLYCSDYRKKLQVWRKKHDPNVEEFNYPWTNDKEWSESEIYALETEYLGEGFVCKPYKAYGSFFDGEHNNVSHVRKAKDKDTIPYFKGIVVDFFEFKVKKETSRYYGQAMAKVTVEDKYGEQISCTVFPDRWRLVHERLKQVKKSLEFSPGVALYFRANVNYYNDDVGLILDQLYNACPPPSLPPDLKAKKVVLKRTKNNDSEIPFEKPKGEEAIAKLLSRINEKIEDNLYDQGLIDLDDEDDEF